MGVYVVLSESRKIIGCASRQALAVNPGLACGNSQDFAHRASCWLSPGPVGAGSGRRLALGRMPVSSRLALADPFDLRGAGRLTPQTHIEGQGLDSKFFFQSVGESWQKGFSSLAPDPEHGVLAPAGRSRATPETAVYGADVCATLPATRVPRSTARRVLLHR